MSGLELRFNPSSGMKSLHSAKAWIDDMDARASDMRPFFRGIEVDVIKELKHEFDISNPNKWQKISQAWKDLKASEGKPANIGIYTGALLEAATDQAVKAYYPTGMSWKIAPVYSIDFVEKRKIGITTGEFLRGLGRQIIKVIIGKAKNG